MKTTHWTPLLAACGLAVSTLPLPAQEQPPKESAPSADTPQKDAPPPPRASAETPPPKSRPDPREDDKPRRGPRDAERRGETREEMRPTPFIGVVTQPLSAELRAQTGLAEGFGLLVVEVMPDSPARTAGIQQHDVLITLGDQKLVNQDQLSTLVRAEKKDAEIAFTIKRAGAEQKVTVKVGERMMPLAQRGGERGEARPWDAMRHLFNPEQAERMGREFERNMDRYREGMGDFQRQMREFGERMQDWARGPKDKPAPQPPQPQKNWQREGDRRDDGPRGQARPDGPPSGRPGPREQNPPPRDRVGTSSRSESSSSYARSVTRRDDSGEYSLREENGAKVFTVRPKGGEEQQFIVNTDDQRRAIPEQFLGKLSELERVPPLPNNAEAPPPQPKQ